MARAYPTPRQPDRQEPEDAAASAGGEGRLAAAREDSRAAEQHDIRFTHLWLRMLVEGFELAEALPGDTGDHPIPKRMWGVLRQGKVPSEASLAKLGAGLRLELRLQTGSACGFRMLALMGEEDSCRRAGALQAMEEEGAYLGGCVLLILSLVLTVPASEAMVAQLTAHYSSRLEDLERVEGFLEELMVALLARFTQELMERLVEEEGLDPQELQRRLQGGQLPLDF